MQIWFLASTIAVSFHSFWSGDRTCTAQPGLVVVRFRPLVWCGRFSTIGCGRILRENWPQPSGAACFPSFSLPPEQWFDIDMVQQFQQSIAGHKIWYREKDQMKVCDSSTQAFYAFYATVWNCLTFIWVRCLDNSPETLSHLSFNLRQIFISLLGLFLMALFLFCWFYLFHHSTQFWWCSLSLTLLLIWLW